MSAEGLCSSSFIGGHRPPLQKKMLAVVADGKRRTNFHRPLRGRGLSIAFRLLRKIDGSRVLVGCQKIRRFFKTGAAHCAGGIDVPRSRNIQRLLAIFVRHGLPCTKSKRLAQSLCEKTSAVL